VGDGRYLESGNLGIGNLIGNLGIGNRVTIGNLGHLSVIDGEIARWFPDYGLPITDEIADSQIPDCR
jgi:hypothetical protein